MGNGAITGNRLTQGALVVGLSLCVGVSQADPVFEGHVVFSGSATYPPHQWLDEDGEAQGFVVDLENMLARRGGTEAEHLLVPWEQALQAVTSGEADAVALFLSEERNKQFDFTEPFYYVPHGIFVDDDNSLLGSLGDLDGRRVAVVDGSYAEKRLSRSHPGIELIHVGTERACLASVDSQDADACVEATHIGRQYADEFDITQTSAPFWPRPYVFGVRKGNHELVDWLNQQLTLAIADGAYGEVYYRWKPELEREEATFSESLRKVTWVALPFSLMAIFGWCFSWYLKRVVASRTRQLTQELAERRKLQDELTWRAEHDCLTGLYSREKFIADLDVFLASENGRPSTVVLIRLLNLEQIILMFSYQAGHDLMKRFGERLEAMDFRQVSHFGSGVFAAVLDQKIRYQNIVDHMTETFELDSISLDAQVVMGVSINQADGLIDAEEMVRRTMTAFSAASKKGKTWLIYGPELEPDPNDLFLLQEFRRNSTRDMFLVYQPKLDLTTGYIQGAEALLRWNSPEQGVVSPERFIPLLEQSGLVTEVTHWVVEKAWCALDRLQVHERSFGISVNIAARDLMPGSGLVGLVEEMQSIRKSHRICLELTETSVIEDYSHAYDILDFLRSSNVSCAVDDFGTGYASLSYLSKLPIDEVKLDQVFIKDMMRNKQNYSIVASTISLAHKLNLTVTAEGVEDMETLKALSDMGCDTAQGYVISRPVPESKLVELLGRPIFDASRGGFYKELST